MAERDRRDGREQRERATAKDSSTRVLAGLGTVLLLLDQGQAGAEDGREGKQDPAHATPEGEREQAGGDRGQRAGDETDRQLARTYLAQLPGLERRALGHALGDRHFLVLDRGHATNTGTATTAAGTTHATSPSAAAREARSRRRSGIVAAA